MKALVIAASAAVLALAVPAMAQAQDHQVYGSIGYANVSVDPISLGALQGRLGVNFNDHFGVEGEAAFGISDDDILGIPVELSSEFGLFGVVRLPVSENVDIFARGGWASANFDVGGTEFDQDGGAYGAGVQVFFNESNGVRADYTRYEFDDSADVWSISFVHIFN